MTRIGICDDEEILLDGIKNVIEESCRRHQLECSITTFTRGKSVLKHKEEFDLLFLDIEMPGIPGIQVASELKKNRKNSPVVVFLTNWNEFARQAYRVNAFRFLIKENYREEIDECISSYIKEVLADGPVDVYFERSKITIHQSSIMYILAIRSGTEIWTETEHYTSPLRLIHWQELLNPENFVRSHKESLVNVAFVDRIEKTIIFYNGEKANISRRYTAEVQQKWRQYISEHAR